MRFRTKCRAWHQVRSVTNIKKHVSVHECLNEADGAVISNFVASNISIWLQSFGCGKFNTTTSLRFIFLNPGIRYISVCSRLSDLFRLNNRAPTTSFHTNTKFPFRSVGDMESLGIRNDANTNTCAKIHIRNRHVHTKVIFVIMSNHLFIISQLYTFKNVK